MPLELQRRAVNDSVKHRASNFVAVLCALYAGVVMVQGGTKLALNVYRGWVGERVKRDLRRRILSAIEKPTLSSPAADAQGIAVAMVVAEVEPIGGFVGESISEPLLQAGILFVPLLQRAINHAVAPVSRCCANSGSASSTDPATLWPRMGRSNVYSSSTGASSD